MLSVTHEENMSMEYTLAHPLRYYYHGYEGQEGKMAMAIWISVNQFQFLNTNSEFWILNNRPGKSVVTTAGNHEIVGLLKQDIFMQYPSH